MKLQVPLSATLFAIAVALAGSLSAPVYARSSCEPESSLPSLEQLFLYLEDLTAGFVDPLAEFRSLLEGASFKTAPDKWTAPAEVWSQGFQAWNNSLEEDSAIEQGGLLVKSPDGEFRFRRSKEGEAKAFTPDYDLLEKGEVPVAVLHTHPYADKEGGWTEISFSGEDLAIMVLSYERVEFVQSGDAMFAAVKSKEFTDTVSKMSDADKAKLQQAIRNDHRALANALLAQGKSFPDAMHQTVTTVAARYGILYYSAHSGEVFRRMK